jgi:hypothetical protein
MVGEGDSVSDLVARRQLNRGYNDGMARAIEVVATPLVFGGVGLLVDGWAGTRPLFTLVLATVGVVGIFVKMWLGYDREMRDHESKAAWTREPLVMPGYVSTTVAAVGLLRKGVKAGADGAGADGGDVAPDEGRAR